MTWNASRVRAVLAVVAGIALLVVVLATGSSSRTFTAVVPAANDIMRGTAIKAGGSTAIGSVTALDPIDGGRAARITMKIDDRAYWPLPRDSRLEVRLGGTVSTINRYILLTRGKDRAHPLANGDALPAGAVKVPVEIDRLLNRFTPTVRRGTKSLLDNAAPVLDGGGPALHRALAPDKAPLAVAGAADVTDDLTRNTAGLRTLVRATSRVVTAADTAAPGLRTLLDGAGQTADAIAGEAGSLRVMLTRMPGAMQQTRTTLAKAEVTLRDAGTLTHELDPGVEQLRTTVAPLRAALARLREVTPLGVDTLRSATRLGPLVPALRRLEGEVPTLRSLFDQAQEQVGCIRPYTPEIVGLATAWGDFTSPIDTHDRMVHTNFQSFLPTPTTFQTTTAAQVVKNNPGTTYGFPRPPGELAGQPWFQPQCGVTKDSLDPSKDKESADFVKNAGGR